MNTYTFHITVYDLALLAAIFTGLSFSLQLRLTKGIHRNSNRFLSLALCTVVLRMIWILGINIRLGDYLPKWSWMPLEFSMALGPLIFFYVLRITRPEYKFRWRGLLHFSPLLLQQGVLGLEIWESLETGAATYDTLIFHQLNPVLQMLAFVSVIVYLYGSFRLIEHFYKGLEFNRVSDRCRHELRWLKRSLTGFSLLFLLWIPYTAVDHFYYHDQLDTHAYYPLYLLLTLMMIRIAASAFSRSGFSMPVPEPLVSKLPPPGELRQKGIWLKKAVEANLLYKDAELSLSSLSEKLNTNTHEISRIINVALKKNFNDFINEYRIREVTRKMQDPAYDRLTLLGIAFDAGFNSKATFNRVFRQMTGTNPKLYKNNIKKERSNYDLRPFSHTAAIFSYRKAALLWPSNQLNRNYMLKNYWKIAWRNVIRHQTNSLINVSGLALGITCCMFIFLWVQDERNIDNFHANGKNLFAAYQTITANGKADGNYNTPLEYSNNSVAFLLDDIKQSIPEVKDKCFYATGYDLPWGHPETIQVGEKIVKFKGARASSDFFKMFSYPVIAGNPQTALSDISSIAISRRMATTFFGNPANALGKTVRYENKYNFVVRSVFQDVNEQSSLKFDFLLNWELQKGKLEWSSNSFQTFIQLADHADVKRIESKINQYLQPRLKNSKGVQVNIGLQPFGEQYLHNILENGKPAGGRITYVQIFSEVAIFILIIACINFMNLATARSTKRAREVGVHKVVGAGRLDLIGQFFGESLLFSFLAMALSLILILLFLPAFNTFTGKDFDFPLSNLSFWAYLSGLTLITGLVAGSYPALYLSSLKPVKVLKGVLRFSVGAIWFRKGLTVFQFTLSILLLIATIVITRQTNYVQNAHLGYERENMIYTRIEGLLSTKNNYLLFKERALKIPGVALVDRTTEVPQAMNFVVNDDAIKWQGKIGNEPVGIKPASVGFDFVKLMKLTIVAGRDFSLANPSDSTSAFLVNQEAVKQMGMKNPIGQWISAWNKKGIIIGVIKDYHTQSLHEPIKPILLDIKEGEYFGVIMIKTQPGKTTQALQSLATLYKEMNPDFPFSYQFVDQEYAKLYSSELIISRLSIVFAAIAILISCLGLLGLVMFAAEQRVKEFGVRKVLGASLSNLITLFATDFMKLVLIAFLIACPLGWFASRAWLQGFAYRVDVSWWIFIVAGAASLFIAALILTYEACKTALMNPVKSLRSE